MELLSVGGEGEVTGSLIEEVVGYGEVIGGVGLLSCVEEKLGWCGPAERTGKRAACWVEFGGCVNEKPRRPRGMFPELLGWELSGDC